jgi:hypothetical protein
MANLQRKKCLPVLLLAIVNTCNGAPKTTYHAEKGRKLGSIFTFGHVERGSEDDGCDSLVGLCEGD